MPNGGPGSSPSSRRPSLRPPSPGTDSAVAQIQPRRGSRVLFDTKTPPSILRWELLNRVLALSLKGDWPAVDQHLNSLERNNMEVSSTEVEVMNDPSTILRIFWYIVAHKNAAFEIQNPAVDKALLISRFFFTLIGHHPHWFVVRNCKF